jgi:hypothetical protein
MPLSYSGITNQTLSIQMMELTQVREKGEEKMMVEKAMIQMRAMAELGLVMLVMLAMIQMKEMKEMMAMMAMMAMGDGGEGGGDEGTVVSLINEFGFTPPENKQYEESYDGLKEMVNDMASAARNSVFAELEERLPDVAKFLEYRLNGGDPGKFFENVKKLTDYSSIEITEENVVVQKQVYRDFLVRSGFTPEEADEEVMEAEQLSVLEKKAKLAKDKLVQMTQKEHEAEQARLKKEADEQAEADRKELVAMQQAVKSGKLATFEVPESEKVLFWNWLVKPVDKEGATARDKAAAAMTREQRLALEYLVFKGVDLTKVKPLKAAPGKAGGRPALPAKPGTASRMGGGNRGQGSDKGGKPGSKIGVPSLGELFGQQ